MDTALVIIFLTTAEHRSSHDDRIIALLISAFLADDAPYMMPHTLLLEIVIRFMFQGFRVHVSCSISRAVFPGAAPTAGNRATEPIRKSACCSADAAPNALYLQHAAASQNGCTLIIRMPTKQDIHTGLKEQAANKACWQECKITCFLVATTYFHHRHHLCLLSARTRTWPWCLSDVQRQCSRTFPCTLGNQRAPDAAANQHVRGHQHQA